MRTTFQNGGYKLVVRDSTAYEEHLKSNCHFPPRNLK